MKAIIIGIADIAMFAIGLIYGESIAQLLSGFIVVGVVVGLAITTIRSLKVEEDA